MKIKGIEISSLTKLNGVIIPSNTEAEAYITRVETATGTVEGKQNLTDAINRRQVGSDVGLELIPSGTDALKLFSTLPTNAAGDFTVAAAANGSKTNELGIIVPRIDNAPRIDYSDNTFTELEPESINLVLQSEDFSTSWAKQRVTVSSNQIIAPDGTLTADKITQDSTASITHYVRQSISIDTDGSTISVYVKPAEVTKIQLSFNTLSTPRASFDLALGTINDSPSCDAVIEDVGDGWFRISITGTTSGVGGFVDIMMLDDSYNPSFDGDGAGGFYLWGAQLHPSELTRYVPTTTTPLGIPPTYSRVGVGALLLEPAVLNTCVYSDDFINDWGILRATRTGSSTIAPNGAIDAVKITDSTSLGTHLMYDTSATTNLVEFVMSCYFKAGTLNFALMSWQDNDVDSCIFDLSDGSVSFEGSNVSGYTKDVGNGWYRCSMVYTANGTSESLAVGVVDNGTTREYTGTGTDYIYMWGVQNELGNVSSSYITCVATPLTRGADAITGAGDVSTFNSEEGVLYAEMLIPTGTSSGMLTLSDETTQNRTIFFLTGTDLRFQMVTGGVNQISFQSAYTFDSYNKIAFSYSNAVCKMYINGSPLFGDVLNKTMPSGLKDLSFEHVTASFKLHGKIREVKTFNTALTDAQLTALTSLDVIPLAKKINGVTIPLIT